MSADTQGVRGWVRTHPVLAGALAAALVGTAHAEYTLATVTGVNEYVALAVPAALDLYVIQALRVHRDVFAAVLVMVAANVVSHLLVAGLYPAGHEWQVGVTAAVGALAPGIVWRVHSLEHPRTRTELLWGVQAGAVKAPADVPVPDGYGVTSTSVFPEYDGPEWTEIRDAEGAVTGYVTPSASAAWAPGFHLDGCDGMHEYEGPDICLDRAVELELASEGASEVVPVAPPLEYGWDAKSLIHIHPPDHVPADWSTAEYGDPDAPVPYLRAVPDQAPAFDPADALHSDHLKNADWSYLLDATDYVNKGNPTVRGMQDALSVGQARATRLLRHLGVLPK